MNQEDEIERIRKISIFLRDFATGIAKKYNMTPREFTDCINDKKNFSKEDWDKLSYFRKEICNSKNIIFHAGMMLSKIARSYKNSTKRAHSRRKWDRV